MPLEDAAVSQEFLKIGYANFKNMKIKSTNVKNNISKTAFTELSSLKFGSLILGLEYNLSFNKNKKGDFFSPLSHYI